MHAPEAVDGQEPVAVGGQARDRRRRPGERDDEVGAERAALGEPQRAVLDGSGSTPRVHVDARRRRAGARPRGSRRAEHGGRPRLGGGDGDRGVGARAAVSSASS